MSLLASLLLYFSSDFYQTTQLATPAVAISNKHKTSFFWQAEDKIQYFSLLSSQKSGFGVVEGWLGADRLLTFAEL